MPRSAGPSARPAWRSPAGPRGWRISTAAQRHAAASPARSPARPAIWAARSAASWATSLGRTGSQNLTGKTLDQRADIRGNVTVDRRGRRCCRHGAWSPISARKSRSRTHRLVDRRHQAQRVERGQAAARPHRQRAGGGPAGAAARRSVPRSRGPPRMGQDVPLDRRSAPAAPGLPNLWLEVRPTRAFAAQPRIDASPRSVLTIGVQAETRIVPSADQARLSVPGAARARAADRSRVASTSRCRSTCRSPRSTGCWQRSSTARPFRDDKAARSRGHDPQRQLAASGDRLLISLHVKGQREQRAGSVWAPRRRSMSGAGRCSIASSRCCGSPTSRSTSSRRPPSGCWARRRGLRCPI